MRRATLIDNESADFDDEGYRWITYCRDHGVLLHHESRAQARASQADPTEWCEGCRQEHEAIDAIWMALLGSAD